MRLDQSRILRLIVAAERYVTHVEDIAQTIARLDREMQYGQVTIQQAWADLKLLSHHDSPTSERAVIWQERWLYDRTHLANERHKKAVRLSRQRKKGGALVDQASYTRPRTAAEVAAQVDAEEEEASRFPWGRPEALDTAQPSPLPSPDDLVVPPQRQPIHTAHNLQAMGQEKFNQIMGTSQPTPQSSSYSKGLLETNPDLAPDAVETIMAKVNKNRDLDKQWQDYAAGKGPLPVSGKPSSSAEPTTDPDGLIDDIGV